jgi:hypothetical protein
MLRISLNNTFVRFPGAEMLIIITNWLKGLDVVKKNDAYVLLLFKDMADLKPNVGVREGTRRVTENTIKATKGFVKLALLLVNNTETKEYFVLFVKI